MSQPTEQSMFTCTLKVTFQMDKTVICLKCHVHIVKIVGLNVHDLKDRRDA